MYNHPYLDPTKRLKSLQRKVQFDTRLYFCHRGAENIEKIKKTDFRVRYNSKTNKEYVIKVKDTLTKTHRDTENIISGIMPENKTDPLCLVAFFGKYISHLNPENVYMLQTPKQ